VVLRSDGVLAALGNGARVAFTGPGQKRAGFPCQVTVLQAGSVAAATALCAKLLYNCLERGASQDQVKQWKNDLLKKVAAAPLAAPKELLKKVAVAPVALGAHAATAAAEDGENDYVSMLLQPGYVDNKPPAKASASASASASTASTSTASASTVSTASTAGKLFGWQLQPCSDSDDDMTVTQLLAKKRAQEATTKLGEAAAEASGGQASKEELARRVVCKGCREAFRKGDDLTSHVKSCSGLSRCELCTAYIAKSDADGHVTSGCRAVETAKNQMSAGGPFFSPKSCVVWVKGKLAGEVPEKSERRLKTYRQTLKLGLSDGNGKSFGLNRADVMRTLALLVEAFESKAAKRLKQQAGTKDPTPAERFEKRCQMMSEEQSAGSRGNTAQVEESVCLPSWNSKLPGIFIGPKGQAIKDFQQTFGVTATVEEMPPAEILNAGHIHDYNVSIRGGSPNVKKASAALRQFLKALRHEESVNLPAPAAKLFQGKNGFAVLKHLEASVWKEQLLPAATGAPPWMPLGYSWKPCLEVTAVDNQIIIRGTSSLATEAVGRAKKAAEEAAFSHFKIARRTRTALLAPQGSDGKVLLHQLQSEFGVAVELGPQVGDGEMADATVGGFDAAQLAAAVGRIQEMDRVEREAIQQRRQQDNMQRQQWQQQQHQQSQQRQQEQWQQHHQQQQWQQHHQHQLNQQQQQQWQQQQWQQQHQQQWQQHQWQQPHQQHHHQPSTATATTPTATTTTTATTATGTATARTAANSAATTAQPAVALVSRESVLSRGSGGQSSVGRRSRSPPARSRSPPKIFSPARSRSPRESFSPSRHRSQSPRQASAPARRPLPRPPPRGPPAPKPRAWLPRPPKRPESPR
ncbi:unnamed protein product, partial [Polarella glacialis]